MSIAVPMQMHSTGAVMSIIPKLAPIGSASHDSSWNSVTMEGSRRDLL